MSRERESHTTPYTGKRQMSTASDPGPNGQPVHDDEQIPRSQPTGTSNRLSRITASAKK